MNRTERLACALALAALTACAAPPPPPALYAAHSPLSGTIRVLVEPAPKGLRVIETGPLAAAAGLRRGDIVMRYNGIAPAGVREFYDLVIDTRPGNMARLEVLRDGRLLELELPVEEVDTAPRA